MRKKSEREITHIAVSRRAHDLLIRNKSHHEPMWHLIDIILASYYDYENESRGWKEQYEQQVEITKSWMKKAKDNQMKLQ